MNKILALAVLGTIVGASSAYAYPVPVMSGGVGQDSRQAIENLQNDFSLKAVFTGKQGIYLSNVNVQIEDSSRNVIVSNMTQGPFLLANLPAGRYVLQANADGHVQRQAFTVGKGGLKTVYFRFPIDGDVAGENPSL